MLYSTLGLKPGSADPLAAMETMFSQILKEVEPQHASLLGFIFAHTEGLMLFYKRESESA